MDKVRAALRARILKEAVAFARAEAGSHLEGRVVWDPELAKRHPGQFLEIPWEWTEARMAAIAAHTGRKRFKKILDCGCSVGNDAIGLARFADKVVGVDIDRAALRLAAYRAEFNGVRNCQFARSAGEKLPFADGTFDLVYSKEVLEHVGDVPKVVAEMARVTKPGGLLYIEMPNYNFVWEGHYHTFMLPFVPKPLFKVWLRMIGKDPEMLDHINYVHHGQMVRLFARDGLVWKNIYEEKLADLLAGRVKTTEYNARFRPVIALLRATGLSGLAFRVLSFLHFYPTLIYICQKRR